MINESLRINPPGAYSDQYILIKDYESNGIKFKKDTHIMFNIYGLHHNPKEWYHPDKFIPERFNPDSIYFKTPSGQNRHDYSFQPFGSGARKCVGYKFAEIALPILTMNLINSFDFEFMDEKMKDEDTYPLA